jgi:hypothetical protein
MTTQVPYSFQKFTDFYDFTTENGIDYRVKFADGAFLFVDFPSHLTVYEVAIALLDWVVTLLLRKTHEQKPPS